MANTLNWHVVANGHEGSLVTDQDPEGNVSGTIFGDTIVGFWDDVQKKLTFVRYQLTPEKKLREVEFGQPNLTITQTYTGFQNGDDRPDEKTLEGYFETRDSPRHVFGWTASYKILK